MLGLLLAPSTPSTSDPIDKCLEDEGEAVVVDVAAVCERGGTIDDDVVDVVAFVVIVLAAGCSFLDVWSDNLALLYFSCRRK